MSIYVLYVYICMYTSKAYFNVYVCITQTPTHTHIHTHTQIQTDTERERDLIMGGSKLIQ